MNKFSKRYLPKILSRGDRKKQSQMLLKSRRFYKKGKYYTRTSSLDVVRADDLRSVKSTDDNKKYKNDS